MKRQSSFIKCKRCKTLIGYDLMTVNTLRTQAVLFLNCNNCREKNVIAITEGGDVDPNQYELFQGSTKV